jgi:lipid-A-disaccharide synthase
MRIFISAGEPSGDLHGANLVRSLKAARPEAALIGFGGPRMAEAGCELLYPLCSLAVMGVAAVVANIHKFLGVLSFADRWFAKHKPDALVLIDYPGLHWWLARRAKFHGIPVFYFVPPQIWAWATWRVTKMQRFVDHVLCNLPFEQRWYAERNVNAKYIGHPYFDELTQRKLDDEFVTTEEAKGGTIIGMLPGSRTHEVVNNVPTMLQTARRLHEQLPDARMLFACYKEDHAALIRKMMDEEKLPVELHVGRTPEIIHLSKVCLAVSGSVGLELLYHRKPSIVLYKVSSLQLKVGLALKQVKYASLVNLLADKELFPEVLTDRCEAEAISAKLLHWLTNPGEHQRLVEELSALVRQVGQPGACQRAAEYVLATVEKGQHRMRRAA